jgi:hypothetical protein
MPVRMLQLRLIFASAAYISTGRSRNGHCFTQ